MMKQLQIVGPNKVSWLDVPIPEPGPGQVLMKVLGITTCPHWDLHLMGGVPMFPGGTLEYPYSPGQPGHEAMGKIEKLGAGVTGLVPGTKVAAWRDAGHHIPGCYAQYVCMAQENVIEIPSDLAPEDIASLELAMCIQVSFDALIKMDWVSGFRFAVAGLGPAGLVALQMAKAYGARQVIGIDPLPERRNLALTLGVDQVMPPDPSAIPANRYGDQSFDAALDCTGLKPSIEFLMDRTRQAVSVFGVLREEVAFGTRHWAGLSLLGYGSHNRGAAERALALVKKGQVKLGPLVSEILPFDRYAEGIEMLRQQKAIKILFDPWM